MSSTSSYPSPSHRSSTTSPLIPLTSNPRLPTTRPKTEIRVPPSQISHYQSLLSLPPRSPLIPLKINEFPRQLLKKPPSRPLLPILKLFIPRRKPLLPHQKCNLCPLHSPLLESPLVHLSTLLSYEMYTHLQSLRALHPALRSEVTNEVLEKLHPWCSGEKRILLPGSTVQGCLACTLGLLYNDTGAMNALAVLGKSVFRRGAGYGQLVEEGWLGWWADGTKGVREVRADRARARRETGLSNAEFTDVGMGVEFREVRWGSKPSWSQSLSNSMVMQQRPQPQTPRGPSVTLGRQQGEQKQEAKLMGPPARPDRVKGQTLWTTREETQVPRSDSTRSSNFQGYQATAAQGAEQQRWSGTTLGSTRNSTRPPPILEKSRLRNQYQQPVPPSPLSPHSQRPKSGNRPTSLHAHQQQPIPSIQRSKPYTYRSPPPSTPISIPRPLQPPQRSNNTNSTSKTPFSPTSSSTPSTETTTSSSWTSAMSSDDDEEESIVGQTILNEDSESEYGDMDEIQQRYLDEHDELMKMVGAPGWSRRKPRVKSYLDTLPTMREDTRVSTRASTRMETQTRRE